MAWPRGLVHVASVGTTAGTHRSGSTRTHPRISPTCTGSRLHSSMAPHPGAVRSEGAVLDERHSRHGCDGLGQRGHAEDASPARVRPSKALAPITSTWAWPMRATV